MAKTTYPVPSLRGSGHQAQRADLWDSERVERAPSTVAAVLVPGVSEELHPGPANHPPGARFAADVGAEAVRSYVEGLSSYRVLSRLLTKRLRRPLGRAALNGWVLSAGAAARSPLSVSAALAPPAWGGFLGVDGKAIWVRGEKHCLLLGVDHPTQDVVHALVAEAETGELVARLVTEAVADAGYPLRGLVSDLAPGTREAVLNYFGHLPFQACRIHFSRRLDQNLPKDKKSPAAPRRAELRARVRAILYAPTEEEARRLYSELRQEQDRFQGLGRPLRGTKRWDPLASLGRDFELYCAHHRTPGLPPDNNITENVVKQLGKKLRLMEGFESTQSAEGYSHLLIGCYRFKRFTDSSWLDSNGKAPLELAGVDLHGIDWLSYLLTNQPQQQH